MSKVFIEETTLSAIGSAIREMTGKSDLIAPGEMPGEIRSIETGGGGGYEPTDLELKYTYDEAAHLFEQSRNYWVLREYGDRITTDMLTTMDSMFYGYGSYDGKYITPQFVIDGDNTYGSGNAQTMKNMFYDYKNKELPPNIVTWIPTNCLSMFYGAQYIREIPASWEGNIDWSYMSNGQNMWSNNYSLRSIPDWMLPVMDPRDNVYMAVSFEIAYNSFNYMYALDELKIPISGKVATYSQSGLLSNAGQSCFRVKDVTFKLPSTWTSVMKNLTLDLSRYCGWASSEHNVTEYNSGIGYDKEVSDATTYASLKNDPDWFTCDVAYSRYNHDSAVNTINSLPSTNGGTGCVVKFKGEAGSKTDGGAINTLTEEEIAVAAAKGWTVSLV